jgi:ATP-binding cassette, subfamily B, bacterial PglK
MNYIQKLLILLEKNDKQHLAWLVLFSICMSAIETIGISAIMPFIDIAINFDQIHSNHYYQWVFDFLGFESEVNFAIFFGMVLFGFFIFRGGMIILYNYVTTYFTENLYAQITKKLYKTYLTMPYLAFTKINSSYLTKSIITEAALIPRLFRDVLTMISEFFVIVFLYALMLITDWKITIVFTLVLSIEILFFAKIINKKLKSIGKIREQVQAQFYEIINRLFGNFKQYKMHDKRRIEATNNEFSSVAYKYSKILITGSFLGALPKVLLETIGFSLIILLLTTLLYLSQSNIAYILPTLSLFAIALYRLLPSANRIIHGYHTVLYCHRAIDIIDEELKAAQEELGNKIIKFRDKIELINVKFSYQKNEVFSNINLTIQKGEKIALIGQSGSGKSTLVDLIIGLYKPNQGEIKIDNVVVDKSNLQNWRSHFGYIPQQVYLFDGTIAENVCFGRDLDKSLLETVLLQANIFDYLQTQQGINTLVGEGGVQLSGGQKQRIAIARALYGEPEILVLDEATSALDEETEKKIMSEIYQISQDKTLIIVAHRLSTINGCDKIYRIKNGIISE